MKRLRGLMIMDPEILPLVYGPEDLETIAQHVEMVAPRHSKTEVAADSSVLRDVEVIFSGWSPPVYDDSFLRHAPDLKAIFNAAGPRELGPEGVRRGIQLTTAHMANSQPVAEYALATILFSLKHGWALSRQTHRQRTFVERNGAPGCYRSTVGIMSLGMIGRILLKLLEPFDVRVLAYDPTVTAGQAMGLGVEKVSLNELFERSDVVSVHAPHNRETEGIITGSLLSSMRQGATFINTARGGVVRERELITVATARTDLHFLLDVTNPEPPEPDSPLYTLPNVTLTPHIAGSAGGECRRMGHCMIEELERFVQGQPLKWTSMPSSLDITLQAEVLRSVRRRRLMRQPD